MAAIGATTVIEAASGACSISSSEVELCIDICRTGISQENKVQEASRSSPTPPPHRQLLRRGRALQA